MRPEATPHAAGRERELSRQRDQELALFRNALLEGMRKRPKRIPSKYLYDSTGSALFEEICRLPEYYPTRTELGLLAARLDEIAGSAGPNCALIELGSGACRKTRLLLRGLSAPACYMPVDIARPQLESTATALRRDFPELRIEPICADYLELDPAQLPAAGDSRLVYFPGSTLGNLEPDEAESFLRRWALALAPEDAFLIGIDVPKRTDILERAYNDSQGVTAAFNLNVLRRANRELGATFDLAHFQHRARYDSEAGRIEMHAVSTTEQRVSLGQTVIRIAPGESIITEHSYKYSPQRFRQMAHRAGFEAVHSWEDSLRLFTLHYLRAAG